MAGATGTSSRRSPSRKSLFWAAMLQCVPLLGAAGCFANGANDQHSQGAAFLLWGSILFWGLGYLYVGALVRFTVTVLAGPILAVAACSGSFAGVHYDYEHDIRNRPSYPHDVGAADRASIQTGIILSLAVMLLAVDAARLAAAKNVFVNRANDEQAG